MRPRWALVVHAPDGTARAWRLPEGEARLGRDPSCAVPLSDPAISGTHLRVLLGAEAVTAIDPGSRHGTFHGPSRLATGEAWAWTPGVELRLGPYRVSLHREGPGGLTTESGDPEARAAALEALIEARQRDGTPPSPEAPPLPAEVPPPPDEPPPPWPAPTPEAEPASPPGAEATRPKPAATSRPLAPRPPPLTGLHRAALVVAAVGAAVAGYTLLRALLTGR